MKMCVTAVHVEDIIFHMFQYIQTLRTEGPQEWVFEECKVINVVLSAGGAGKTGPTYSWLVNELIEQPWPNRLMDSNLHIIFTILAAECSQVNEAGEYLFLCYGVKFPKTVSLMD